MHHWPRPELYPDVQNAAKQVSSLSDYGHGVVADIVDIDHATPALLARLAARGLVPGARLEILRGGDPMLVMVDDSRWALTREDAVHIRIQPMHVPLRSRLRALFA